ncbi:MAG: antitoxin YezG family protein [Clostridia bacterium]|nr:antitoxin YezG family protein [Clostridia bacterium]
MLNHTKKIKDIYEDIQKKLFYMIPEKWEELYLYSSVLDKPDRDGKTGELYFYYFPKGILKKKAVNVYEIPARFNVDERQYLKLVEILYSEIKQLRQEFKKANNGEVWSNLTMIIKNFRFKVDYDYTDLNHYDFNSFQRHIIWRYEYLGIGPEQLNRAEKEILKRYIERPTNII